MERNEDPTAATVAANLKRLRTGRSWSVRELADRLTQAGRTFSHSAVTRTENGTRQASVGDLMSLAAVFNVSPLAFLLPMADRKEERIEVTGLGVAQVDEVWAWARGGHPMGCSSEDRASMWRFQTESLPAFLRFVEEER